MISSFYICKAIETFSADACNMEKNELEGRLEMCNRLYIALAIVSRFETKEEESLVYRFSFGSMPQVPLY